MYIANYFRASVQMWSKNINNYNKQLLNSFCLPTFLPTCSKWAPVLNDFKHTLQRRHFIFEFKVIV